MKFAVVTGANKGIGFGIVKALTQQLTPANDWTVILTARNESLGTEAANAFKDAPVKVVFRQLDITNAESITNFVTYVQNDLTGLDILVNNAGMAFKNDSTASVAEQAQVTLETNFWGTLNLTNALLPHLRKDARVVFVSSFVSLMTLKRLGDDLYSKFTSPMTLEQLEQHMRDYVEHAKIGDHESLGWPSMSYGVSKLGVTKLVYILYENLRNDPRNFVINSCCPGYVDTDMSSHKGTKTVDEGADTPTYLATLPLSGDVPNGKFVSERAVKEWTK